MAEVNRAQVNADAQVVLGWLGVFTQEAALPECVLLRHATVRVLGL